MREPPCVAVLAGNTLLRPLVNSINRAPIDERKSEAIYEVHVVTGPETVGEVRDLLAEALEKASYPIRQIEVVERSLDATEIVATLVSTAVDPVELDAVAGDRHLFLSRAGLRVRTNRSRAKTLALG